MTDETAKLLNTVVLFLIALITAYGTWQSRKNGASLDTVNKKVDGMSSDLVAATKEAAGATGQLKERDAERVYVDSQPSTKDEPVKVKVVKPDIEA